jgi:hypothetical protein
VAVSFDEPGIQVATLSLLSVSAVLSLASVMLGLFSTLTGKDPLPKGIRRLLRRTPASVEDFHVRGMSLTLGGVGVMLIVSIITTNVVNMLNGIGGYAPSASLAFPKATVFLITVVVALSSMTCFVGSYILGVRVRYVSTRASTGAHPGMPPAQ